MEWIRRIPVALIRVPLACWFAVAVGGAQQRAIPSGDLQVEYGKLRALRDKIDQEGTTPSILADRRRVLEEFINLRDVGARFLLKRLKEMNVSESKLERTSSEWVHESTLKCEIFLTLGRTYTGLSKSLQQEVTQALAESITWPVIADSHGGAVWLSWALFFIGRDAVNEVVPKANDPDEAVRCYVADSLNDLKESVLGISKSVGRPPALDCKADLATRTQQVSGWMEWWKSEGNRVKWREIPDMSDILGR